MDRRKAKQFMYGGVFLLIFILFLTGIYFLIFKSAPTCFDNKKNQGEEGIDCGGPCIPCGIKYARLPAVSWVRGYSNGENKMTLAAEIKNPNLDYGAQDFIYSFEIRDKSGNISKITGHSFIYAGEVKYLMAPIDFDVNNFSAAGVSFSDFIWKSKQEFSKPQITVKTSKTEILNPAEAQLSKINFTRDLFVGLKGDDVKMLKDFLKSRGFFDGSPDMIFDAKTRAALIKYQKSQKISATGYFGGKTRENINTRIRQLKNSVPETGSLYPAVISGIIKNDDVISVSKVIINGFIFNKLEMTIGASKTELENIDPSDEKDFRIIFPQNLDTSNVDSNLTKVYIDAIK